MCRPEAAPTPASMPSPPMPVFPSALPAPRTPKLLRPPWPLMLGRCSVSVVESLRPTRAEPPGRPSCPQVPPLGPSLRPTVASSPAPPPPRKVSWPPVPLPWGRRGGAKPDNLLPGRADSPRWFICPQAPWLGLLLRRCSERIPEPQVTLVISWPPASPPRGFCGGACLNNLRPDGADSPRRFICPQAPKRGSPLRPSIASSPLLPSPIRISWPSVPPPRGRCGGAKPDNLRPEGADSPNWFICPQAPWMGLPLRRSSVPTPAPLIPMKTSWPLTSPPRGSSGGACLNNLRPGRADSPRRFICPLAPRRGPLPCRGA